MSSCRRVPRPRVFGLHDGFLTPGGSPCNYTADMMEAMDGIRVLLVDDHAVVRAGYRRLLTNTADIQVEGEADSGEEAYRMVSARAFDVAVMDLSLPGMGGIEACSRIRRRRPDTRVLVFSVHEEAIFVRRALDAGAAGYLTKRAVADMLVQAVREVAAGRRYVEQALADTLTESDPLACLSQREFEIFRLLANGHGVQAIAEHLYLSSKTVSNHASRVRTKLGTESPTELIRLAIRRGVIAA